MKSLQIQAADAVMMVRPVSFGFNEQTASSNAFQVRPEDQQNITQKGLKEFDDLKKLLSQHGVNVITINDTAPPTKPDAVFCNNWISFHHDGTVILYPMLAPNRRLERRLEVLEEINHQQFKIDRLLDYSKFEETDKFLESTGSMVIDYVNKIIYACISPRTDPEVLQIVANQLSMDIETCTAVDKNGMEIYHTNVLMNIGHQFTVICDIAIKDRKERNRVLDRLSLTGHEVISLSYEQMYAFAGNMLQLRSQSGQSLLVMSTTAYQSLLPDQIEKIEKYTTILKAHIPTIEQYGGGSVRCMLGNIHLPRF